MQHRHPDQNKDQARHAGKQLRKHRRPRRARNAPAELQNKQQVKPDVEQRRARQDQHRRFAVAQGADKARQQIVKHRRRDPEKDGENVLISALKNIFRRLHQAQNRPTKQRDRRRYRNRKRR